MSFVYEAEKSTIKVCLYRCTKWKAHSTDVLRESLTNLGSEVDEAGVRFHPEVIIDSV